MVWVSRAPNSETQKSRTAHVGDFGVRDRAKIAHAAVSRRPPISLYTSVARTQSYTYDANVWDSSLETSFGRPPVW
jgi:hypothetical protein